MQRRKFLREGARGAIGIVAGFGDGALFARQKTPAKKRIILVWSEGTAPKSVYPKDINGAIADSLAKLRGYEIRTASLSDAEQGVSQQALDAADVLLWWGHQKHAEVSDAAVDRIVRRVKEGVMGFAALHSAHFSKPLKSLLGTSGAWSAYVEDGKPQQIEVANPQNPIARSVRPFTIPQEERYEEPFVVPAIPKRSSPRAFTKAPKPAPVRDCAGRSVRGASFISGPVTRSTRSILCPTCAGFCGTPHSGPRTTNPAFGRTAIRVRPPHAGRGNHLSSIIPR